MNRLRLSSCLFLFSMLAGCGSASVATTGDANAVNSEAAASADSSPWVDVRDNAYGVIGSVTGTNEDGSNKYKYELKRAHFGDVLEDLSETTETSVTCSDSSLLDKGLTVEFEGTTPAELFQDLASKIDLQVEQTGPNQFVLSPRN